jgi:N4-gp56 family major capsid protein
MSGTITQYSVLTAAQQTAFDSEFLLNFTPKLDWGLLVDWQTSKFGAEFKGKTISVPVHEPIAPATTPLVEDQDANPVAPRDSLLSVTMYDYGLPVQDTKMAQLASISDLDKVLIETVAQNKADTENMLVRAVAIGGTDVLRPYAGELTRVTMTTTNSKPSREFLQNLYGRLSSRGTPTFDDGTYVSFVHPTTINQILAIDELKYLAEYQVPSLIWTGEGPIRGKRFPGEVFTVAGIRFVRHEQGKLYLSGGVVANSSATAITAGYGVNAGETTLYVDETTGLAVGNFITVGTLEANTAEQVEITAASASSGAGYLTIRGAGKAQDDWGFKYDHVAGSAVTEAPNVCAIPVMGPKSIRGILAAGFDRNGKKGVSEPSTNIPGRFRNYYWENIFGLVKIDKRIVRGECCTSLGIIGDNRY